MRPATASVKNPMITRMPDRRALTLLFIRHAEKPELGQAIGIDARGNPDKRSLTPRGWQCAGAWVQLFKPALGGVPALPEPSAIFASDPGDDDDRSSRPLETVTPLAAMLDLTVDHRFAKGQEAELAGTIEAMSGVVLVCWQHETIGAIVGARGNPPAGVPSHWPGACFNAVYQLDRSADGWSFSQIMPVLLDGDPAAKF